MRKFLSNSPAMFMSILLIVIICAVAIQFIVHRAKESNTKSIADGHICCVCGGTATNFGTGKYYCASCYDNEFGDLPVHKVFPK